MEREKRFTEEAIRIAVNNIRSGNGRPFGVVVVRGDEIIAAKGNSAISSNDPVAHAEINVTWEACHRFGTLALRDCEIFVCSMCMAAIYWARLKKVMLCC